MEIIVNKYNIPVIYLDTFVIIDLVRAINNKDKNKVVWRNNVISEINRLILHKKAIFPGADQYSEIDAGKRLLPETQELLLQISREIQFKDYITIEEIQTKRLMKAYIQKEKEVVFESEDIFIQNPYDLLNNKNHYLVGVYSPKSKDEINRRKLQIKKMTDRFEIERIKNIKNKETFEDRLRTERLYHVDKIGDIHEKMYKNKKATREDEIEIKQFILKPFEWFIEYSDNLKVTDPKEQIIELKKFFSSEYFFNIPFIDIRLQLTSDLMMGNEIISPSDYQDIHEISAIMPYAQYMIVDKRMTHRIKKLNLDKKYNTKLIKSSKDLLPFLQSIK
ncbi:MAG: hypothetical protein ACYDBX_02155 [Patescibacteria group bacterium]